MLQQVCSTSEKTAIPEVSGIKSSRSSLDLKLGNTHFFFRVIDPWNSLPNQVVKAPTVESFERRLDRHWRGDPRLYDFKAKI